MHRVCFGIAAVFLVAPAAAQATTVIIYIDPMTFDHYTKVINTPGRDRAFMCMAPPAISGCTEIPIKRLGQATDSSNPSKSLRPSTPPWAGSTTRSG